MSVEKTATSLKKETVEKVTRMLGESFLELYRCWESTGKDMKDPMLPIAMALNAISDTIKCSC